MASHRDRTSGQFWALPALLIPLVVAAVAWTAHVSSEGAQVAPNVRFAGIDISGLTPIAAAEYVSDREREVLSTPVIVDLGERRVVMTAAEIGYDYLYNETVSDVVSARHPDGPWEEFVAWVSTPLSTVAVEDHYMLDEEVARQRLARADFVIESPVEPVIASDGSSAVYVETGIDGVTINIDQVIEDLKKADVINGAVEVDASRTRISPTVPNEDAEELVAQVNRITGNGLLAIAGDQSTHLGPSQVQSHIVSTVEDGAISADFDLEGLRAEIESGFPEPVGEITPPEIEVDDGEIVVVAEGSPPQVCCSEDSVMAAAHSYLEGGPMWYVLDTRTSEDPTHVAWADGSTITEPVAEFTTHHSCCENRVVNIQTIADALTGKYLIPGETLSLNEFVGPRTREKGYLPAGAIRAGYMTDEVGGGVSQFVTTLFNAAFLAGLDLDEYQSHTVYFSRYPFGREATLSMPGPDLVMTNNTAHPVLIWPSYTDTSITVTMYSTPNVEVSELDHRISFRNQCRHSQIDRQRTFSDGRVVVDTIVANYRPGDGLDCNGNPLPQS